MELAQMEVLLQTGKNAVISNQDLLADINTLKEQVKALTLASKAREKQTETGQDRENQLFDGSSHSYLVYYETTSLTRVILGVFVIALQIVLLVEMMLVAIDLLSKDLVEVHISYKDCLDKDVGDIDVTEDRLVCDADDTHLAYATLAFILMACFVMKDFFECFEALLNSKYRKAKIGAVLIFIENLFAAFVASLFTFQGVFTGSGYDALVNTVGILFIHDLDEKMYEAVESLNKATVTCRCFCCLEIVCKKYARLTLVLLFIATITGLGYISVLVEEALDPDDTQ